MPNGRLLDSLTSGRAPAWGAAIAEPGARTILLRADQDDLPRTLRHELAHLALHEAVAVRVPLWFDEGYAAWAAGEWERFGGLELNLAVVRGAIPSLTALDGALRGSASTADAAYALAASAVTELARRNPTGTLAPLLQRLERGEDRGILEHDREEGAQGGRVARREEEPGVSHDLDVDETMDQHIEAPPTRQFDSARALEIEIAIPPVVVVSRVPWSGGIKLLQLYGLTQQGR